MESYISRIQKLSKNLDSLLPMKEEFRKELDKKFRLEFTYNSNNLEGNTLTYGETKLLLIFDETGNGVGHQFREYEEMKAHDVAYALICEWAADKERPLSEANIKNLNEIILVRPFWKEAITPDGQQTRREIKVGDYKQFPNSVRLANGEIFDYVTPQDTPIEMGQLVDWYRREEQDGKLHPVEMAALLHYKFVRIHPFDDGNGRISRLLINYVVLRHNLPPIIIKSADKPNYLRALHEADAGNIQAFVDYVAEQAIWSLEISIKAGRGESIDEPGDLDKKIALLKRQVGDDPGEVVRKKDSQAVANIYQTVVMPLAAEWENRLKKFDSFFFSRMNTILIDQDSAKGEDLGKLAEEVFKTNMFGQLYQGSGVQTAIRLGAAPRGLRKTARDIIMNGGEVQVHFFENAYELRYTGGKNEINRLYTQPLKEEEIATIADALGAWLFDFLEKELIRTREEKR